MESRSWEGIGAELVSLYSDSESVQDTAYICVLEHIDYGVRLPFFDVALSAQQFARFCKDARRIFKITVCY
jgi:hypothetical protein